MMPAASLHNSLNIKDDFFNILAMLKHSQTHFVTHSVDPDAYHLGDLINIIQPYHLEAETNADTYYMFANTICPCCGVNTGTMMRFLLDLLDTRIRFKEPPAKQEIIYATPMWFWEHIRHPMDYKPYAKVKLSLPKGEHVVCQFDARSQGNKRPTDAEIDKILYQFPNIINIGDKQLMCRNQTDVGLREKFKLIATARHYIGIDSGLTHLALMTNTPTHVIHPKGWEVRRYYPKCKQIKFSTSAEELLAKINRPSPL